MSNRYMWDQKKLQCQMWNKACLIDGGGVLTDDRYAMVWLSQACL